MPCTSRIGRARRDGATLCIHVKRAPLPTLRDVEMSVPRAWRRLEAVGRGLVVALSLERNLRGKAIESALAEAFPFLEAARAHGCPIVDGVEMLVQLLKSKQNSQLYLKKLVLLN